MLPVHYLFCLVNWFIIDPLLIYYICSYLTILPTTLPIPMYLMLSIFKFETLVNVPSV